MNSTAYITDISEYNLNFSDITVKWNSPSNIALVKYWGKYGTQLPRNPSISFSLKHSFTVMEMTCKRAEFSPLLRIKYFFEGKTNNLFQQKIEKFLNQLLPIFPFLQYSEIEIESQNSFPHSAGIASSASSMSALALCLCTVSNALYVSENKNDNFLQKASYISRLGSGSACRSIYGGFSVWGESDCISGSSNEFAVPFPNNVHADFRNLQDAILIVSTSPKEISSSKGHALMEKHIFAEARYLQANNNLQNLVEVLQNGNFLKFSEIIENEAFTLHSLMMTSTPSFTLLLPETLQIIKKIQKKRKEGLPVCFTLDAGPNVHLIYPECAKVEVVQFIENELLMFCEQKKWIDDFCGSGATEFVDNQA